MRTRARSPLRATCDDVRNRDVHRVQRCAQRIHLGLQCVVDRQRSPFEPVLDRETLRIDHAMRPGAQGRYAALSIRAEETAAEQDDRPSRAEDACL